VKELNWNHRLLTPEKKSRELKQQIKTDNTYLRRFVRCWKTQLYRQRVAKGDL